MDQPSAPTDAPASAPSQPQEPPSTPETSSASGESAGFLARGRARRRARFLRKARELAYRDLGGLVFSLHRYGKRNDELVLAKLGTISRIDTELRALEAVLDERRPVTVLREAGVTACPRCAAIHSSEDRFCASCGLQLSGRADLPIAAPRTAPAAPEEAAAPASAAPRAGASSPAPPAPGAAGAGAQAVRPEAMPPAAAPPAVQQPGSAAARASRPAPAAAPARAAETPPATAAHALPGGRTASGRAGSEEDEPTEVVPPATPGK